MKTKPNSSMTLGIRGVDFGGVMGDLAGRYKAGDGDGDGVEVLGGGLGEEAVLRVWRAIVIAMGLHWVCSMRRWMD